MIQRSLDTVPIPLNPCTRTFFETCCPDIRKSLYFFTLGYSSFHMKEEQTCFAELCSLGEFSFAAIPEKPCNRRAPIFDAHKHNRANHL